MRLFNTRDSSRVYVLGIVGLTLFSTVNEPESLWMDLYEGVEDKQSSIMQYNGLGVNPFERMIESA